MNLKKTYIFGFALLLIVVIPLTLKAAEMSSSNYKIIIDSLNVGGNNSVSSNYNMQDTVGEIATGDSSSANYAIKAGYQQMVSTSISISAGADIALSSIGGVTGGTSTGQTAWNVVTDNPAGYSLSINASTSPALRSSGGASFADYVPSGAADFTFTILTTASAFGFSPEGPDIISTYKDNGSACNTGSSDTADACWDGFSTTTKTISQEVGGGNSPTGATTTLKVRAASGSNHIQDSGNYTADITATAVQL